MKMPTDMSFLLIYTALFFAENYIFYKFNKRDDHTEQQRGNILGFKTAVIMSLITIYTRFNKDDVSKVNVLAMSYFTGYLLADLYFGMLDYHSLMCNLSGYVHHVGYVLVNLVVCLTGNIETYLSFFVEEITSIVRNIGYIDKRYRMNHLFGGLFFLLRIVLHLYLVMKYRDNKLIFRTGMVVWILHCYWFITWCKKFLLVDSKNDNEENNIHNE